MEAKDFFSGGDLKVCKYQHRTNRILFLNTLSPVPFTAIFVRQERL